MRSFPVLTLSLLLLACGGRWSAAQERGERSRKAAPAAVTPERVAAATTFARLHHPELEKLIQRLEKSNPRQYQRAIRQLYQASERLARVKSRDEKRYELELEAWKLDSRLRLLAARLSMADDAALEEQLQPLVEKRVRVKLRLLRLNRERLQERLQRVESMIRAIEDDPARVVEREMRQIQRGLKGRSGRRKATVPVRKKRDASQRSDVN